MPVKAEGYKNAQEWVSIAEDMAKKNGGMLPNPQALIDMGFWALYQQMRRRPELFAHIKRTAKPRPKHRSEAWVQLAEKLASQHHGVLPSPKWLCDHNFRGLYAYILENRDLFGHIRQEKSKGGRKRVSTTRKLQFRPDSAKRTKRTA